MIYTVTLNPALDYMIQTDDIQIGNINKIKKEYYLPGGKGINVSIVLNNLNTKSVALGFLGGFSGKEIERLLKIKGIQLDMIEVEGNSRINIKIKSNEETEINGTGPNITELAIKQLVSKLNSLAQEDILVLSGSIPNSVNQNIYQQLALSTKAKTIIDTTGEGLRLALTTTPFLIKPNINELSEFFNVTLNSLDEVYEKLCMMQQLGARNIVVSMAKDGALLMNEDKELYYCKAEKGVVKNSVGAGDSMVAGFIYQYLKTKDLKEAFKFSCATGSASAFSEDLATRKEIENILINQTIIKLK